MESWQIAKERAATKHKNGQYGKGTGAPSMIDLQRAVQLAEGQMWPTPNASDWKNRDTSTQRACLPRAVRMWPTPRSHEAGDWQRDSKGRKLRRLTLTGAVKMWPTPNATDGEKAPKTFARGNPSLPMAATIAEMYPTPTASDAAGGPAYSKPPSLEGGFSLKEITPGPLNPAWVEWLMGFPLGWTDLED